MPSYVFIWLSRVLFYTYFSLCLISLNLLSLWSPWERSNSKQESNILHNLFVSFILLDWSVCWVSLPFVFAIVILLYFLRCSGSNNYFLSYALGKRVTSCFDSWYGEPKDFVCQAIIFLFMSWTVSADPVLPIIHINTYKQGWEQCHSWNFLIVNMNLLLASYSYSTCMEICYNVHYLICSLLLDINFEKEDLQQILFFSLLYLLHKFHQVKGNHKNR